jgi:rod shape-determining protein MreC
VAVLLAQLFFLAYQIKTSNEVRLLRVWALAVLGPVEVGVHGTVDAVAYLYENYISLTNVRRENRRLQAELDQARLRLRELESHAAEADELAALLQYKQTYSWAPLVAARVIGSNPAPSRRFVYIDRGRPDGLRPNMVVLTPEGVVGKIVEVTDQGFAQVLLISDPESGVGALVVGPNLLGVVKGTGGALCRLDYIPAEASMAEGAEVVTSGQDRLYPKGLPLGRVTLVSPGESFLEVRVQPAAPLGRLEHVLVLAGPPESLTTTAQAAEAPPSSPR